MSRARELVERHIEAFNNQDVEALLADFDPLANWVTGDYTVPEGQLREFFTSAMQTLTPRLILRRMIEGESAVAIEMTEDWTYKGDSRSSALIAVFDLRDEKITRAKIYREGSADA